MSDESPCSQKVIIRLGPLKISHLRTSIAIDVLDEFRDNDIESALLPVLSHHVGDISYVKSSFTGRSEPRSRSEFCLESPILIAGARTPIPNAVSHCRQESKRLTKLIPIYRLCLGGRWVCRILVVDQLCIRVLEHAFRDVHT